MNQKCLAVELYGSNQCAIATQINTGDGVVWLVRAWPMDKSQSISWSRQRPGAEPRKPGAVASGAPGLDLSYAR